MVVGGGKGRKEGGITCDNLTDADGGGRRGVNK